MEEDVDSVDDEGSEDSVVSVNEEALVRECFSFAKIFFTAGDDDDVVDDGLISCCERDLLSVRCCCCDEDSIEEDAEALDELAG